MTRGRANHHHATPPTCSVAAEFGDGGGTEGCRARSLTHISRHVSTIVERAFVDPNRRHHELFHADSFSVLTLLLLPLLLLPHGSRIVYNGVRTSGYRTFGAICFRCINNVWLCLLKMYVDVFMCIVLGCCYYCLKLGVGKFVPFMPCFRRELTLSIFS